MGYRSQSFASAVATIRPFWPARIGPIATCFVLKGWPVFPFVLEIAYPAAMATPTSSDRTLRNTHAQEYSYQLLDLLAAFIFLLSASNLIRIVHSKLYRFQRSYDVEEGSSPSRAGFSWRRAPLALLNAARIVAFRWTLKIGESYTLNPAEIFLTVAYIIALFTWTFINSEGPAPPAGLDVVLTRAA
jgi:hypothetical protein